MPDRRSYRGPRRHPAEITRARLLEHYERWHDQLTDHERDAVGLVAAWRISRMGR